VKIKTKAEADRDTLAAIERSEAQITKLQAKRSKYSGRELKDVDQQIAQLQATVRQFQRSML